jgi:hypothetical protein
MEENLKTLQKIIKFNSELESALQSIKLLNNNENVNKENQQYFPAYKILNSSLILKECKDLFKGKIESGL